MVPSILSQKQNEFMLLVSCNGPKSSVVATSGNSKKRLCEDFNFLHSFHCIIILDHAKGLVDGAISVRNPINGAQRQELLSCIQHAYGETSQLKISPMNKITALTNSQRWCSRNEIGKYEFQMATAPALLLLDSTGYVSFRDRIDGFIECFRLVVGLAVVCLATNKEVVGSLFFLVRKKPS